MSIDPMPKRYVKGVGMTKFSMDIARDTVDMCHDVVYDALNDANTSMNDIDAAVVSTVDVKVTGERQRHYPPILTSLLKKKIVKEGFQLNQKT